MQAIQRTVCGDIKQGFQQSGMYSTVLLFLKCIFDVVKVI